MSTKKNVCLQNFALFGWRKYWNWCLFGFTTFLELDLSLTISFFLSSLGPETRVLDHRLFFLHSSRHETVCVPPCIGNCLALWEHCPAQEEAPRQRKLSSVMALPRDLLPGCPRDLVGMLSRAKRPLQAQVSWTVYTRYWQATEFVNPEINS